MAVKFDLPNVKQSLHLSSIFDKKNNESYACSAITIFHILSYTMDDNKMNEKAVKFWRWFSTVAGDIRLSFTRMDLIAQLDAKVALLGRFDWEIGPHQNNSLFFAISPCLDPRKLELTKQIIQLAPDMEEWAFLPAKPLKPNWQGVWKMNNQTGGQILIQSADWLYMLFQYDDGTFEMDLKTNTTDLDDGLLHNAIDIALTGYLGEERYMQLITHISVVSDFDDYVRPTQLRYINTHIASIS